MPRPILKRAAIERGLVEVVAEKGLAATSIQDIATRAGVSAGLLYRYWENRDELAAAVYRQHHQEIRQQIMARIAGHTDARTQLRAGVQAFYEFVDFEPVRLKFLLLSQHDLGPRVPGEQRARALLAAVFRRGVEQGYYASAGDEALTIELMLGMILQPAIGLLAGAVPPPLADQASPVCDAIDRALAGEGRDGRRPD